MNREIEVRCSEPGCSRKTRANATDVDARLGYLIGETREPGWRIPSERGMPTAAGLDWVYGTCPDHARQRS